MICSQAIGSALYTASGITALVSVANIAHGARPEWYASGQTAHIPSINFYEIGGVGMAAEGSIRTARYQISCRASSATATQTISDAVISLFDHTAQVCSGFAIQRVTLSGHGGVIYEPEARLYHSPLTFTVVYVSDET